MDYCYTDKETGYQKLTYIDQLNHYFCDYNNFPGGINLHIEQEKHKLHPKLDQIAPRNLRMSLDKCIAFKVKIRHLLRKIIRQQNMTSVIRIYLLCWQTVLIAAGPGAQYKMQVSSMFMVNFMFCPSKANSWRF